MLRNQVVIYTNQSDSHADVIIPLLESSGAEPVRLNTEDIPGSVSMTMETNTEHHEYALQLQASNRFINFDRICSVWWRQPERYNLPKGLSHQEDIFARNEIDHFLAGLFLSLDCYWINDPRRMRGADAKPEQLERAKRFGFDIPRTLISNNATKVRDFYQRVGTKMIYKTMTDPCLNYNEANFESDEFNQFDQVPSDPLLLTLTTLITDLELDLIDQGLLAPGQFQELLVKKFELRITVIGNQVFAAEINSQENEKTSLDFRDYTVPIQYKKANLPETFLNSCRDFVHSYGLNYGAMDFVVTKDDRLVFLENNPGGQFMFVEQRVPELKMANALTSCLVKGKNL